MCAKFLFYFIFSLHTYYLPTYTSVAVSYKIYRTWYFIMCGEIKRLAVKRQIILSKFLYICFRGNIILFVISLCIVEFIYIKWFKTIMLYYCISPHCIV